MDRHVLAIDIETKDPFLTTMGPGIYRKDSYIAGVAVADDCGYSEYFDIGHEGTPETVRKSNVARLLPLLATDTPKIGANILYDLDYIVNQRGFTVGGRFNDVQTAEALLDEYRPSYALDVLGLDYLGHGKDEAEIDAYAAAHGWKGEVKSNLWRMPPALVGKYSVRDASMCIDIFKKQSVRLVHEELMELYRTEIGLTPLLLQMKKTGIRMDESRRKAAAEQLEREKERLYTGLKKAFGRHFNWNSTEQLAEILLGMKLPVNTTDKGNASVKNEDLEKLDAQGWPHMHELVQLRKVDKVLGTFINGSDVKFMTTDGRIHTTLVPVAHGDGGTVSGRFSSKKPNLQQQPGKDGDDEKGDFPLGTICRSVFVPEEGCDFGVLDLSQIEFRMMVHYASGPGAEEMRQEFRNNPRVDYHSLVAKWTGLERADAKRVTFGLAFGMGRVRMQQEYGWDDEKITYILKTYFENIPFLKTTQRKVSNIVLDRGYIRTIGNRRARITRQQRKEGKEFIFFNRLQQGSAADYNKVFMLKAYEAGIFDVLFPHLTIHDEMDVSVPRTPLAGEAFFEMKHIMETAITLNIPVVANAEIGDSMGTTEKVMSIADRDYWNRSVA